MERFPERNAVVYCEGYFNTANGKTAHGLVRFTRRYNVCAVVDSCCSGQDAGYLLDGHPNGIPIVSSIDAALIRCRDTAAPADFLVVGLAPDGGRLSSEALRDIKHAIRAGLNVDCGLHDFLTENDAVMSLAREYGVVVRDIRKPRPAKELHFFSGKIERVKALKIAVLGTDSAVGKRTTAWRIVEGFNKKDIKSVLVGTGQTAWMQGAQYCIILDSLINDFVSGEIEHAVWEAWNEVRPDVIVIEGQGSIMNPAYPGGFELLAAGRPDVIVLQHAPARKDYDGFPGYPIHPLPKQMQALELLSGKPTAAVTVNHENIPLPEIPALCRSISITLGLPVWDILVQGVEPLVAHLESYLKNHKKEIAA